MSPAGSINTMELKADVTGRNSTCTNCWDVSFRNPSQVFDTHTLDEIFQKCLTNNFCMKKVFFVVCQRNNLQNDGYRLNTLELAALIIGLQGMEQCCQSSLICSPYLHVGLVSGLNAVCRSCRAAGVLSEAFYTARWKCDWTREQG